MSRNSLKLDPVRDWPKFRWDDGRLAKLLAAGRHQQGRLVGQMEALGFRVREEAVLRTLTEDVVKSSEIEGEKLDADQVRSSVARRLGIDIGGLQRFYSMSAQIREERGEYYGILEQIQRGTMDVTAWMEWFLGCLTRAIEGAQAALSGVIAKAHY